MPRLVRGIHPDSVGMAGGWVYIVTNKPNGTLYVGVTADMPRRAWEHREGVVEGFTKRYSLKHWPRQWKINLIQTANPEWKDLYEGLA